MAMSVISRDVHAVLTWTTIGTGLKILCNVAAPGFISVCFYTRGSKVKQHGLYEGLYIDVMKILKDTVDTKRAMELSDLKVHV